MSLFCSISALTAPRVYNDRQKTGESSFHTHTKNFPLIGFLGRHSICTCVNIKHQWQLCADPLARCVSHCTGGLFWPNHSACEGFHPNVWLTNLAFCRVSAGTNYWCPLLLHDLSSMHSLQCKSHKPNPTISIMMRSHGGSGAQETGCEVGLYF